MHRRVWFLGLRRKNSPDFGGNFGKVTPFSSPASLSAARPAEAKTRRASATCLANQAGNLATCVRIRRDGQPPEFLQRVGSSKTI